MNGRLEDEGMSLEEVFLVELRMVEKDPRRQARLLAYLRLRHSEKLVKLAQELSWKEETRWHALEILRRNGIPDLKMPRVEKWDWLKIDEKVGICLVWIPPGEFTMGAEEEGKEDERPAQEVVIKRGFWMGKYPVTNREYLKYLKSNPGLRLPRYWYDSRFNVWDQPVVGVSWNDSCRFAEKQGFILPNEAQWEYACRANGVGKFCATRLDDYGWLGDEDWLGERAGGSAHGVGLKRVNRFGLCDMHGNVLEWCEDVYDGKAYGKRHKGWEAETWTREKAGGDGSGWEGDSYRVLRGGSWLDGGDFCRSANRRGLHPAFRGNSIGFRVVSLEVGPGSG